MKYKGKERDAYDYLRDYCIVQFSIEYHKAIVRYSKEQKEQ